MDDLTVGPPSRSYLPELDTICNSVPVHRSNRLELRYILPLHAHCNHDRDAAMSVSFVDLQFAFEFASFGAPGENRAILDTQSGRFYYHSEVYDNMEEDELPDDIDDEKYIEIPHKKELGLGKPLVLEFVQQFLPDDYDEVRHIFSRKGAYGQFKAMLVRRRALDRWHDFSAKEEEAALRQWCADNAIELVD